MGKVKKKRTGRKFSKQRRWASKYTVPLQGSRARGQVFLPVVAANMVYYLQFSWRTGRMMLLDKPKKVRSVYYPFDPEIRHLNSSIFNVKVKGVAELVDALRLKI